MSKEKVLSPAVRAQLRKGGLQYIPSIGTPGICRYRKGRSFAYRGPNGKELRLKDLERIAKLVIPPAWRKVWICCNPHGHLQATGIDARGRKQYRYHADFRALRDETKFHRIVEFAEQLPALRKKLRKDIRQDGLPRTKVLATVVELLEKTLIRVGNEEYARSNKSYGLTTVQDKHVKKVRDGIKFSFVGKSGVAHNVEVSDRRLCTIVLNCQEIPGQHLFQYLDSEGKRHNVCSTDVNQYIREISGTDYSAKDFRTWKGTVLAAMALERVGYDERSTKRKKLVAAVVKDVAEELRNRPATCRKYYIHPLIIQSYDEGRLVPLLKRARTKSRRMTGQGLSFDETTVLQALRSLA